ncbi:RdgB/HAM1 family non-canonical purine NTP pyrophosphatase [Agaribacterium haliotis]|uniref:RdgB/HAM1 family non-canonical purine NTP pyrophosphatase n=1 Tax=Agaribacterium haliotis TaxID=2013869 RepID=UPI000BB535E5|nr:RdgB/HAM1 family non-canonical purine NTP pyrophosphatase [Agaribacterium haliotis]
MKKVVLASGNQGKLNELSKLFAQFDRQLIPQKQLAISDADETGLSFVENAIIKARHAAACSGLPALADDSGIEVDALNGAPGIYSARYAGANADDSKNNIKLLEALAEVPEAQRSARYQCVLVFMRHKDDPTPIIAQGSWEGKILTETRGEGGFGYDPLFWLDSHQCTSAELDKHEKNRISHRAIASIALMEALKSRDF